MTTTTRMSDLTIRDGLSVVTLDGFDGEPRYDGDTDPVGSANYFCELYGMAADEQATTGILRADYDAPGWRFSLLIDSEEADELADRARVAGYEIISIEPIAEPTYFGDSHDGTVEILRHRDGWVIVPN